MEDTSDASNLARTEALLIETFGLSLLAYLCACDADAMRARLEGEEGLPDQSERVLRDELVPLAQQVAARRAERDLPLPLALNILGKHPPDAERSIGNLLRVRAGGSLTDEMLHVPDDDDVITLLAPMALDAYPLFLAPTEDRWWPMTFTSSFQHPLREELQQAVETDSALARLYPEEDPVSEGRRGYYYSSLGRGGGIQSVGFGETVISAAWHSTRIIHANPSPKDLIRTLCQNIGVLREAASGGTPNVRSLIVFTGLTMAEPQAIETAWGPLRPLTDAERQAAPPSLEGALTGTDLEGGHVAVSYAGELVLETSLPYRLRITETPDANADPTWWSEMEEAGAKRRWIEGLQLATLLAIDREPGNWVAARPAWTWTADPMYRGPDIGWWDVSAPPSFTPYELTPDDHQQVSDWTEVIEEKWVSNINIAVRRVLRATNSRTDMADRLVDAAIAWENLFGTRQGEPRLRIASAMAWLLADDVESRDELRKALRDLYDRRSKIVHGASVDEATLATDANHALDYALETLRKLFHNRPDLLALDDGASRSVRLILGG